MTQEVLTSAAALLALISGVYSFLNRGNAKERERTRKLETDVQVLKMELESHKELSEEHHRRLKSDIHAIRGKIER